MAKTISLTLSDRTAEIYESLPEAKKVQVIAMLTQWLEQSTDLATLMDEISDLASSRGLTPEILEELLKNEP